MSTRPRGLAGVTPDRSVGVAIKAGVRSAKSGSPILTDRFWMMDPMAASREYGSRKMLTSEPHPSFKAWNEMAKLGRDRVAAVRGNIVHARLPDAAWWRRAAQKLPEPHKNPPSQRPACEGDGIAARRFAGVDDGVEIFQDLACPNELCPFAMSGQCKPSADLLFRLRWDEDDPFERQFPSLIAHYHTGGWRTLRRLLGLFEFILGTEAVAPFTPREEWKAGLAADLGLTNVSLLGMPFSMVIGMKTIPSKAKKFPVVAFSHLGDMGDWLIAQHKQRTMLGGGLPLTLPPAPIIATTDEEFEPFADNARGALDPNVYENVIDAEVEPEHPATREERSAAANAVIEADRSGMEAPWPEAQARQSPAEPRSPEPRTVATLSSAKAAQIYAMAAQKGAVDVLEAEVLRLTKGATKKLTDCPASLETVLLGFVSKVAARP